MRVIETDLWWVGMQNSKATLEDGLAVSYKTERTLNIWSSNRDPQSLPTEVENLCPCRYS